MTESARYQLSIVSPEQPPEVFVLDQPIVQIGRDPERNTLPLLHNWVSRVHARIYCDREPYRIEDMGSSNGTRLNDLPLAPHEIRPLKVGDTIAIGPFRLTLETTGWLPEEEKAVPEEPEAIDEGGTPAEEEAQAAPDLAWLERLGTRRAPGRGEAPPVTPPPGPPAPVEIDLPSEPWVGMNRTASRWLQYLPPGFADSDFVGRYLLIFEDMLGPIQQLVAHMDLLLDPATAPESFLPWLNDWMAHLVDEHWAPETQRALLHEISWLHQARGTRAGLVRFLEIATGCRVDIEENSDGFHTFRVILYSDGQDVDRGIAERIIEINRPAHASFSLQIV